MKKRNWRFMLYACMLGLLLALVACNSDDKSKSDKSGDKKSEKNGEQVFSIEDFNVEKKNEGEAIDGGHFKYGLVTDTAFEGLLNFNFYSGEHDDEIIKWFDESLLAADKNHNLTQDGAATFEIDDSGKVFTFKIRDNVNWHDGKPVTAEDWAFAHEVIADPDYTGVRYGEDFTIIEGMEEYHSGKADSISGIEVINDKTLKITYKQASPSLLSGGIWSYALPKHIFKDIPVAKMTESPEVREKPIGFGPFKVESITPGEAVVLTKNEDYWQGEPKLDKVTVKVVNPKTVVQALKTGEVDTVDKFPVDQYPDNANMSNVEFLGNIDMAYSYIGFKLGTWDKKKKEVKPDPNKKMADVNLRKAMWHAIDNEAVGKQFYNGLRWNATTLIPPSHPNFHDQENPGLAYDPEKAKKILDEAGYKDVNNDGMRENPDGEELVINFASMSGGDTAEPVANYYIQAWKEVGLNVQLLDGRLHEFNSFYDRIGNTGEDDPKIDVYMAAWGVATDVNPAGLYGRDALFNYTRYASEENDKLLAEGASEKAMDQKYRQKVYKEWQQLMVDEVPVIPTHYRAVVVPVNNRVLNYTIEYYGLKRHEIAVTKEEPMKAE
ncbi:oligopeptide ABC transporter substrate-binding protein [Virgibacillus proomii]|jgi:peptide/nickel transport system substrate-binding protein|uniref:oligopeptide ABC transporter substrate-binding protein n=1 Tax=Virgibacillus proomii TaxID=84407 RepID=UPI000985AF74|nr:oligopeptide ABC transporter substrate-binding protein [Virgibacillus proomii]